MDSLTAEDDRVAAEVRSQGTLVSGEPFANSYVFILRICDGRMSGTAYGTVVLHVSPEAAAGGPLGLVQDGDEILLDVAGRRLELLVSGEELQRRRIPDATKDAFAAPTRGWEKLYVDHVLQADTGADLDFLVGATGPDVARESH